MQTFLKRLIYAKNGPKRVPFFDVKAKTKIDNLQTVDQQIVSEWIPMTFFQILNIQSESATAQLKVITKDISRTE